MTEANAAATNATITFFILECSLEVFKVTPTRRVDAFNGRNIGPVDIISPVDVLDYPAF